MNQIECATEGRVATDLETRTSKAGKSYARFRLVVGDGDQAQWLSVTAIGPKAMEVIPLLAKSDRLYLEGSLKLEKWTGQDGVERSGLSVLAWKLVPLAKIGRQKPAQARPTAEAPQAEAGNTYAAAQGKRGWQAPGHITDPRPAGGPPAHDEIPFGPEVR
jgi:single-strand DNA-binding protein